MTVREMAQKKRLSVGLRCNVVGQRLFSLVDDDGARAAVAGGGGVAAVSDAVL